VSDKKQKKRAAVRDELVDVAQRLVNSQEGVENAYVTGYVVALEIQFPGHGAPLVHWFAGNGMPVAQTDEPGLASHRVDGLLRRVLRDLYSNRASDEV